ncbi:MAG: GGDEF domain-containing protein [Desulfobacter sp.]|nr:MAG: GGDEF domain-containing protein [Desulfobacter sp.]
MKKTINKFSRNLSGVLSLVFTSSIRRADAYNKLSRHIVALNRKSSAQGIINEVADCLKEILDYRLFAFVVKKEAGLDVWLDPRMYKSSIEEILIRDFNMGNADDIRYLNHEFEKGELQEKFSLDTLVHYDLKEENCSARLYMMPQKGLTPFHDEVVRLILQGCAAALSKQIEIEALNDAAAIDPLTGCYNRRAFERQLLSQSAGALRHKRPLSVFMFDLDHFKRVNDTYGHLGGDEVLKKVSRMVRENIRKEDLLAKYGGEEFIAILPETDKNRAMELADRIRAKIAAMSIPFNGSDIHVTASFGVAELSPNTDITRIIEDADAMLYKAKLNGRNTVMPGLIKVCEPEAPLSGLMDCVLT